MLLVSRLCLCAQPLRGSGKLLLPNSSTHSRLASRQLITPVRFAKNAESKGFKLSQVLRANGIMARFCSSPAKPRQSKAVGYWLLGCSGMVFAAVVLGMVVGYMVLLHSVYYIVNIVLKTTNGSK